MIKFRFYWVSCIFFLVASSFALPALKSVISPDDYQKVLETLSKDLKNSHEITISKVQSVERLENDTNAEDDGVWVDIHKHTRIKLDSKGLSYLEAQLDTLAQRNASNRVSASGINDSVVKYIVLGDMGSTGSRLYLFKARVQSDKTIFVEPMPHPSKKVVPGIAKLAETPHLLSAYVSRLVESIEEWFSADATLDGSSCIIFFKATAGMRVVSEDQALNLINQIDQMMTNETHLLEHPNRFEYIPGQSFQVISGAMEGIFGWITMNWFRNTLEHAGRGGHSRATFGPSFPITTAVLDLGGASSQITFEYNSAIQAKSNYIPVHINHTSTELYTHSYLQFGYNEAIRRYNDAFALAALASLGDKLDAWTRSSKPKYRLVAYDPCFWNGFSEDLLYYYHEEPSDPASGGAPEIQLERVFNGTTEVPVSKTGRNRHLVKIVRRGRWNQTMCSKFIRESLLHLDTFCPTEPCAMAGVYQPPVPAQLPIAAIGTFADVCMFFHHKCSGEFPVETLLQISNDYCGTLEHSKAHAALISGRPKDEAFLDLNTACLKLQYMHTLLTDGFGLSNDRLVIFKEHFSGMNTGWALGAAIHETEKFAQQLSYSSFTKKNTSKKTSLPFSTIY